MFDYAEYKKDFPKGKSYQNEQLFTHLASVEECIKANDTAYFDQLAALDKWRELFTMRKNEEKRDYYQ